MQFGFILMLLLACFIVIFGIQNGTPVAIDLFVARYQMPLAVIMMICLILGALMILLLGAYKQFKKGSEIKGYKNQVKLLEEDKIQLDNNIKAMETQIINLKETNISLAKQISEFENKKEDNSENGENSIKNADEIKLESIGIESKDEKSEL